MASTMRDAVRLNIVAGPLKALRPVRIPLAVRLQKRLRALGEGTVQQQRCSTVMGLNRAAVRILILKLQKSHIAASAVCLVLHNEKREMV
jgi:hypothetical protein